MSTSGSESNNAVATSKLSNIWSHVASLVGSNLTPHKHMVVSSKGTTVAVFVPSYVHDLCAPNVASCKPLAPSPSMLKSEITHCHHPQQL